MNIARSRVASVLLVVGVGAAQPEPVPALTAYLRDHAQAPAEYVLATARSHRITILGEAHWLRQDVLLVGEIIPLLHQAGVDLAAEMFPAAEQARIDALLASPEWNEPSANAIMRAADWPYQEYRDLLRAAWAANRGSGRRLSLIALGPPPDWRDTLLPHGVTYDAFMADLVGKHVSAEGRRIVVYCGMHHAFTRYYQAELDNAGRASGYMDRMGNILSRRFGERVFLIALHKPIWCGSPAEPSHCLPFAGRIDCASAEAGKPVGFDVVGSPFADLPFEPGDYMGTAAPPCASSTTPMATSGRGLSSRSEPSRSSRCTSMPPTRRRSRRWRRRTRSKGSARSASSGSRRSGRRRWKRAAIS